MTTAIDNRDTNIDRAQRAQSTDTSAAANEGARAELRDKVEATPNIKADAVAGKVVAGADSIERTSAQGAPKIGEPTTEPTPENRERANQFRDEFQAIDEREKDVNQQFEAAQKGDNRTPNGMRFETLGKVATHAQGIQDPAERDRFVRAIAPDAGRAAGRLAESNPTSGIQRLDAIGKGVSADTGRLLANSALQTPGGKDNLLPMGLPGTPVGNAMVERRQKIGERAVELGKNAARALIPGVDAASRLADGDVDGAAKSAAIDLAGGAILKGGKLAIGAAVGAGTMAPEQAQAGVLTNLTMRLGRESVEFQAKKGLVNGRTAVYDVRVPGRFKNGTEGNLRLVDERGKHNTLGTLTSDDLGGVAKKLNKKNASGKDIDPFKPARKAGQFTGDYNTAEGQAKLARLVMERITPQDLAKVGQAGGRLDVPLDRVVGLTPNGNGQVVVASSVRVMRNNTGDGFHLVPMP